MADVKISELPAASTLAGDEPIPVVQSAETRRSTPRAIQRIPVNDQTGTTYALVAADAGRCVRANSAAAIAVTAPTGGIFTAGDVILLRQVGAGHHGLLERLAHVTRLVVVRFDIGEVHPAQSEQQYPARYHHEDPDDPAQKQQEFPHVFALFHLVFPLFHLPDKLRLSD